ncbi:MAG: ribonuclease HI family protein [bacterium]
MKKQRIQCDGGSRGNPGPAAAGSVLIKDDSVVDTATAFLGIATNNLAEYHSVLLGIDLMRKNDLTSCDFYLDSQLVVRQLNGQYKVKHPDMIMKYKEVQQAMTGLELRFHHVPRADNVEADAAVNQCLDLALDKKS